MINATTLETLKSIVGSGNYIDQPSDMEAYVTPWRGEARGKTPLVVFPTTTEKVSEVLKHCFETGTSVVPQGGNTGLVWGSIPDDSDTQIVLCLSRLNKVREIDTKGMAVTVEAGVILQTLHETLAEQKLMFPMHIGSEGSCEIGGIVSTNAGGVNVLRYGNTRDLVLGLEVVMANGDIVHGLKELRKDNTGYNLDQLFIGSEGTLGIVTAATLRLFPEPVTKETAFVGVESMETAVSLLDTARKGLGEFLSAYELISAEACESVLHHMNSVQFPLGAKFPYYVLLDVESSNADIALRDITEAVLMKAYEAGVVKDVIIAESLSQRKNVWTLRESISEAGRTLGYGVHFDVSLPIHSLHAFYAEISSNLASRDDVEHIIMFGHLGDGNVHISVYTAKDAANKLKFSEEIKAVMYQAIKEYNGSISAEHGVGTYRKKELLSVKSESQIQMMKAMKQALDPKNILNPGKVIDL